MEAIELPVVDYGVARFSLPGQSQSGDHHLVCCNETSVLVAAIDGIGHGDEAAHAAKAAAELLKANMEKPLISLVELCHEGLKATRGVVLSVASIDCKSRMMTWLGVGNVQGVLVRAGTAKGIGRETLLLRSGVVGSQLPPLQAAVLSVSRADTLIFATDGVRNEFSENSFLLVPPQKAADKLLELYGRRDDDALVLVARLTGIRP